MAHCKNKNPCWSDGICRYSGNCPNKAKTFSDSIRDMSDSDLAEWLTDNVQKILQKSGYFNGSEFYNNLREQLKKELSKEI